jgi:hypothetical protein
MFLATILAMLACNLPGTTPPASVNDLAATSIAATLLAQAQNGGDVPITATFPPIPDPSQSAANNTPTASASRTITPTFSTPVLTVLEQTNCRTGPGKAYEVVFTYLPKAKLNILGRYDPENYWLVKSDESPTGQCWLWGEFVEVAGSYWAVPSVTPPPTATQAPPNAPTFQSWDYTCSFNGINNDLDVILIWSDKSSNETGYRFYRDGGLVTELPANTTTYTDSIAVDSGQNTTYRIEAYNPTGSVSTSTISISCP